MFNMNNDSDIEETQECVNNGNRIFDCPYTNNMSFAEYPSNYTGPSIPTGPVQTGIGVSLTGSLIFQGTGALAGDTVSYTYRVKNESPSPMHFTADGSSTLIAFIGILPPEIDLSDV